MRQYQSESKSCPESWDKTSSPDVVYNNVNVTERIDPEDSSVIYCYDVIEYTRREYESMVIELQQESQEQVDVIAIDHEYRLIMLELEV